jgi:hypothetical protein
MEGIAPAAVELLELSPQGTRKNLWMIILPQALTSTCIVRIRLLSRPH